MLYSVMGNKCNENEGTFRVGIQIMIPISYLTEYKSFHSVQHWEVAVYLIGMVALYLKFKLLFYIFTSPSDIL